MRSCSNIATTILEKIRQSDSRLQHFVILQRQSQVIYALLNIFKHFDGISTIYIRELIGIPNTNACRYCGHTNCAVYGVMCDVYTWNVQVTAYTSLGERSIGGRYIYTL